MPKTPNQSGTVKDSTPFEMDVPVQMDMSDEALITFGPPAVGGLSFHDVGYMPVNAVTIAGNTRNLPGGGLDRMFISYEADGVQHFDTTTGAPTTADYTGLHYELWSYKGQATFGHAADGTPTVSGPGSHSDPLHKTLIARGDLLQGHLASGMNGGISGEVDVSVLVNGQRVGELDISVRHSARDIGPAPGGFTLTGGALHATFVPLHTG